MSSVIDFLISNYQIIIIAVIVILLAIIGGYADRTNFGQPKNNTQNGVENGKTQLSTLISDLGNKRINDQISNSSDSDKSVSVNKEKETVSSEQNVGQSNVSEISKDNSNVGNINVENSSIENGNVSKSIEVSGEEKEENTSSKHNNYKTFESDFDKFNEEFDAILPKKDIIDNSLLNDINNLTLDKTQKIDLSIPDLDDVELPKIRGVETDEKEIWKK